MNPYRRRRRRDSAPPGPGTRTSLRVVRAFALLPMILTRRPRRPARAFARAATVARYTRQDTGRRCISHRTRSRVPPTPARENILCDRERVPGCHRRPCSHLVVLSGVHRFATCVAAARSASSKGCPLRAGRGAGSKPIACDGQSPASTSCPRCRLDPCDSETDGGTHVPSGQRCL
jgi:hypothetical protein